MPKQAWETEREIVGVAKDEDLSNRVAGFPDVGGEWGGSCRLVSQRGEVPD